MEIEMKYSIPDEETAELLWQENEFAQFGSIDAEEKIFMKAVYFDTKDYVLHSQNVTFRIRQEGPRIVATMKWGDRNADGFYVRDELNVPLMSQGYFNKPTLSVFHGDEKAEAMMALVGDEPLIQTVETAFERRSFRLDTGTTLCEVALDIGTILTAVGQESICELEIELFTGKAEEIIEIGDKVAKKYDLQRGQETKYGRGWAMLQYSK